MGQMIPTVISDAAGRSLAYQFLQASFSVAPAGSTSEQIVLAGKFSRLFLEIHNKGAAALNAVAIQAQCHPASSWMTYLSLAELSAGTALPGRLVAVLTANPTTLAANGRSQIMVESAGLYALQLTMARAGAVAEDVDLWGSGSQAGGSGGGGAAEAPGSLKAFAMAPPTGWLDCNGAAVSRTTYAPLFAAIGTVWGVGDGSTTFNLPDFRGRSIIGVGTGSGLTARALAAAVGTETHQLAAGEMPAHTHSLLTNLIKTWTGAVYASSDADEGAEIGAITTGSAGNGTAHANMQPSIAAYIGIKT